MSAEQKAKELGIEFPEVPDGYLKVSFDLTLVKA